MKNSGKNNGKGLSGKIESGKAFPLC